MSFTLLPFLYQTRTILRFAPALSTAPSCRRLMHKNTRRPPTKYSAKHSDNHTIPFVWEPDQQEHLEEQWPADDGADKHSTITPSEQRVFDELFRSLRNQRLDTVFERQAAGQDAIQWQTEKTQGRTLMDQARSSLDREKILLMYPPSLRAAAQKALGMHETEKETTVAAAPAPAPAQYEQGGILDEAKTERLLRLAEMERLRDAEKERVYALMRDCKSDVELWDVLEKEVFSMVGRLGLAAESSSKEGEASKNSGSDKNRRGEAKKQKQRVHKTEEPGPVKAGGETLCMDVYGPLYSIFLLTALQRLDGAYAAPSPLALNILPRVTGLGLASYVLGASTPFYNELMTIHWRRHGDLDAVMRLLGEMEYGGLFYNRQTVEFLGGMIKTIAATQKEAEAKGGLLATLLSWDSYALDDLREKRRDVEKAALKREAELEG